MCIATENYLSNSQFLHLSKKGSASLQEEYVDPAWILLRAVIYLETNSITIGPFFLCFKRKFIEKCPPPPIFEENSMGENLILMIIGPHIELELC